MQRTRSDEIVDARMNLAAWLRAGRDRRKLTIEDVSKITKIQPRILEKLESGQLEGLPAEVFVKGFVRSFAKCVGLDESEALTKYSAAQSQPAIAVVKALVDTISGPVRVVTPAEIDEPVIEVVEAAPPIEAPAVVEAPAIEAPVVVAAAQVVEQPQPSKKKKSRKNAKQRARKKKQELAAAEVAATEHLDGAVTSVFEKTSIETGPVARIDGESLEAMSIEAKTNDVIVATDSVVADCDVVVADNGIVEAPSLAEGSDRISKPVIETLDATDTTGTWQPTMPPIAMTPSVPWRRPNLPATTTTSTYVVPTLVIDDADPDSADREREDRIAKEPHRISFLPPILLDREDRSARQGGLTLAVIILLIAATLTLSYLMRRPSSSGDGVTMLDGSSMLVG